MGKQYTADKIIISGGTSSQFLKGDGSLDSTVYQSALGYTPENLANKATSFSTVNDTLYPTIQAVKTYADSLVAGLLDDRGSYNASVNTFPTTGGSGTAGAVLKGDFWYVSAAGTLGGVAVNIGDSFRALVDTPGQTATNWSVLEGNLGFVPYNSTNPAGYTSNLGTVTSISMTVPTGLSISGSPITSSGTLGLTFTAGYSIPTDANQTNWTSAYTNRITSLTTTGSSGASTLVSNVLNIPNYTLSGLGGQPLDADLTAIAALAGASGILIKTALNTWSLDTNTYLTSSTGVTTFSAGTTGLTPSASSSGAITLGGILNVLNGGTGSSTAAGARTNLGATTVGGNVFTSTNPTAITFLRANADNTVSWLDATTFRAAIGAGTSSTVGTVTSVSALSFGTTGTDLSSTVATETTTPVITLNVPTASATNRGALSSADWTTFNGKQNALTNPVTGTGAGATNTIPKFTGVNDLGNSGIIDNGTTVNFSTSNVKITGADATTRFSVGNSSSTAYIDFYGQTHATIPNDIALITNATGRVRFFTTATERASILANGNFLIGTTTDSGDKLRVNGTTLLGGNVNIAGIIKTSTSTGEFLRSDATVAGASQVINIYNSAGTRRMHFGYGSTSSESLFLSNDLNGDIILKTNATERINISSAGVVKVNNLSGTGTRTVVADASGNLSAIPTKNSSIITAELSITNGTTSTVVTLDTNATYLGHVTHTTDPTNFKSIIVACGQLGGTIQGAINIINNMAGASFEVNCVGQSLQITNSTGATATFRVALNKIGIN